MTSFALPIPSATGSLDSYIQTVNRFPHPVATGGDAFGPPLCATMKIWMRRAN